MNAQYILNELMSQNSKTSRSLFRPRFKILNFCEGALLGMSRWHAEAFKRFLVRLLLQQNLRSVTDKATQGTKARRNQTVSSSSSVALARPSAALRFWARIGWATAQAPPQVPAPRSPAPRPLGVRNGPRAPLTAGALCSRRCL